MVGFAQKYVKDAGIGTIVALMLPYTVVLLVLWTLLADRLERLRSSARTELRPYGRPTGGCRANPRWSRSGPSAGRRADHRRSRLGRVRPPRGRTSSGDGRSIPRSPRSLSALSDPGRRRSPPAPRKGRAGVGRLDLRLLDLEVRASHPRDIGLTDCRFAAVPVLRYALIDNLFLDGSALPGLDADRLEARGGVSLKGAVVTGELRLSGCRLDGNLSLDGASVTCPGRAALTADGIALRSVELRGARIDGETRMTAARVDGDLELTGARLSHPDGEALHLNRTVVRGGLFLRAARRSLARSISPAHRWIRCTTTRPHGRRRRSPSQSLPLQRAHRRSDGCGASHRLARAPRRRTAGARSSGPSLMNSWLTSPDMGHDDDAQTVLVEKERLQRAARRARATNPLWRLLLSVKDGLLGVTLLLPQAFAGICQLFFFWGLGVVVRGGAGTVCHQAEQPGGASLAGMDPVRHAEGRERNASRQGRPTPPCRGNPNSIASSPSRKHRATRPSMPGCIRSIRCFPCSRLDRGSTGAPPRRSAWVRASWGTSISRPSWDGP